MLIGEGIVGDVAEVLRAVVVDDVALVGGDVGGVVGLVAVALLIPAPVGGSDTVAGDLFDVGVDVHEVELGVVVGGGGGLDLVAHEGERERGVGEVGGVFFLVVGDGLGGVAGCVHGKTPVGMGVIDHRQGRDAVTSPGHLGVEHPLGLAGLAGDHGDGVGAGGADDGVEEVVEESEAVGVLPEERGGVAIDVGHGEFAGLLVLEGGSLAGLAVDELHPFLGDGVAIVAGGSVEIEVELGGGGYVRVVVGADVGGIERDGFAVGVGEGEGDAEGLDGGDAAVGVDDGLIEARNLVGRMREEAFGSGVGSEVEVEGAVLLEEDEDVFHMLSEELELFSVGEQGLVGEIAGVAGGGGAGRRWGGDDVRKLCAAGGGGQQTEGREAAEGGRRKAEARSRVHGLSERKNSVEISLVEAGRKVVSRGRIIGPRWARRF